MNIDLTGKHALVCGCTQGIGRAAAEELASLGATVTALARNPEKLEELVDALPRPAEQSHGSMAVDFQSWEAVRDAGAAVVAARGDVHILINNSGGPPAGPAHVAEVDAFLTAFNQHLAASQALVQTCVDGMRRAQYGRIINIISTSVITPIKGLGVSNTIRGAMGNWGRTLAAELGGDGITVNNVLPGFTSTKRLETLLTGRAERQGTTLDAVQEGIRGQIPAGRMGDPEELGAVIAFLASPAASYVNGVNLPVDGGRTAAQ